MIIDKRLQVSSLQALTETAVSTDVIDLGQDRDIGPGDPLYFVIIARTGLADTTPTFAASVQTDDASGFGSPTTLLTGEILSGAAAMPTGKKIVLPVPHTNERFLRLNYTLGGTTPTVTVDAFLTKDPAAWQAQADAI